MQISDAEWQVMKIIWMQGNRLVQISSRFWRKVQNGPNPTIQTLLARLVEKECLTRKKKGKSFVYSALLTLDQVGIYWSRISRTRFVLEEKALVG